MLGGAAACRHKNEISHRNRDHSHLTGIANTALGTMSGRRIRPLYSRVGGLVTSSVELKIVRPLNRGLLSEDGNHKQGVHKPDD